MDNWDPQRDDYESSEFNSYDRGPGQHFNRKMDYSEGVKLYVTGIPNEITEEGLHNMFSQCGTCISVKKCVSKQPEVGDTYGFVLMKTQTDAIAAITSFNNYVIGRFKMRVQVALDEETMKRHKQKKQEEEEFYQNLPSVRAEQKRKQQMQTKPLRSITRTIENGHQSDTDSSSEGRCRKPKKGPGSVMNGHEDSSVPALQPISGMSMSGNYIYVPQGPMPFNVASPGYPDDRGQRLSGIKHRPFSKALTRETDDLMEMDTSVLHYQVSPRNRGVLGRGNVREGPYYQDYNPRPGRGRGSYYGNAYHDTSNSYGGGYGRGMPSHDSWGYHHGRGGFLNDFRDPRYRRRPDFEYEDDYGYATDFDGYHGGYRRDTGFQGQYDGYRGRGRRGFHSGYPGDFGRGRGYAAAKHHGSMESLASMGGASKKPVIQVENRPCLRCGKSGQFQCARCKGPYCSSSCQKTHWATHKKECGKQKKEIYDDLDGDAFEVSIGNDIVQQTKTLVEKHTGEELRVTKKPVTQQPNDDDSETKAKESYHPKPANSPGLKQNASQPATPAVNVRANASQPVTPAVNARAKSQSSPVSPQVAAHTNQQPQDVNASALETETRGVVCKLSTLPLNTEIAVMVSEVVNPGEIWVQVFAEEFKETEPLREHMTAVYQTSTGNIVQPKIGDMFAGMFSLDNNWYRARVDAVEGDKVSVTYMDYGNKETVSCSRLQQLQQDMVQLPLQAIECCLKDMKPLKGDSWGREAEDVLKLLCPPTSMCSKLYKATAHTVSGGKYTVSLEDIDGENIGEKLIASKTVSSTKGKQEQVEAPSAAAAVATVQEAREVPALPYSTVPFQETSLVLVTEVFSPDEIWVQPAVQEMLDRGNGVTEEINKMMDKKLLSPVQNARIGNLYAALFGGRWYRGRLDTLKEDKVEVTYVEFGNRETISVSDIFELTAEQKSIPFSVVHCCLAGIVPCSGTTWSQDVIKSLKAFVPKSDECGAFYKAFGIESGGHLMRVQLTNDKDEDIAAKLVEAGVAKYGNRPLPVYPPVSDVRTSDPVVNENQASAAVSKPSSTPSLVYSVFPIKEKTGAMILEVESPDEIWLQEAVEEIVFRGRTVTGEINHMVVENQLAQAVDVSVGNLYAAMFKGDWYRARLDSFEDSDKANLTYVEFGNKGTVKISELKELTPEHKAVPCTVVHCFLDGIVPASGSDWNSQAIKTLKEIAPGTVFYEILGIEDVGHLMKVKLFDDTGADIAEKLVQKGVARHGKRDPPVYPPVSKAKKEEKTSSPVVLAKSLGSVMDNLQVNQKVENLLILEVESPALFVVRIGDEKMVRDYKRMEEELETVCDAAEPAEYRPEQVGQLVVGKFEGQWYRAEVLEMNDNSVKVRYLDFGNVALNDFSTIQQPTNLCMTIPAQACFCGLVNVSAPPTGIWPNNIQQKFFELASIMNPKPLEAVYKGSVNGISMIDILDCKDGRSISLILSQELSGAKPKSPVAVQPQKQMDNTPVKAINIQMESLPLDGTKVKAGIIDITSFDSFFLHLAEKQGDLEKLKQNLSNYCVVDTPHSPVKGELVCAKFSMDKLWYRAEVLKVTEDNLYQVMFVDWGNCETVSSHSIREIHPSLATLPKQAIHCRLKGVNHKDQIDESFIEFVSCVNKILLEIKADSFENNMYSVTVIGNDGFNYNEHFGEKGKKPEVQVPDKVLSPFPHTAAATKKFTVATRNPPENEEVSVALTHIENPQEFYCQIADREWLHKLVLLMQNMMMYCEMEPANPAFSPKVGDLCCAMYTDSQWYRGEVLKVFPDKSYQVKYFDFGNKEVLSGEQIREMTPEYVDLPKLAFKCSLIDVSPAEGQSWDNLAKEKMQRFSEQSVLTAKCVGKSDDGTFLVELCHNSETESVNIAEFLKSNGFARAAAPAATTPALSQQNGETSDKEAMLLEQIAALQAQLQSLKK